MPLRRIGELLNIVCFEFLIGLSVTSSSSVTSTSNPAHHKTAWSSFSVTSSMVSLILTSLNLAWGRFLLLPSLGTNLFHLVSTEASPYVTPSTKMPIRVYGIRSVWSSSGLLQPFGVANRKVHAYIQPNYQSRLACFGPGMLTSTSFT